MSVPPRELAENAINSVGAVCIALREAEAELRELQEALRAMVKEFDDLDEDELLATPAPLLLAWGALTNVLAASSEEPG